MAWCKDYITALASLVGSSHVDVYMNTDTVPSMKLEVTKGMLVVNYINSYGDKRSLLIDKFVKKYSNGCFPLSYQQHLVELLEIKYKIHKAIDTVDDIVIWPSSKILYAYLHTNYFKECGTIGNSCMRSSEMQKALNFYVKNKVKIAVLLHKTKVKSRALLWENVIDSKNKNNPMVYLDRCYYSSERQIELYKEYATKNKIKSYHTTGRSSLGEVYIKNLCLDGVTHLPYTDTFRYLDPKNKVIYSREHKNCLELNTTQHYGYFPQLDPRSVKEVFTKRYVSKKDSVYVKQYKGYVLKRHILEVAGKYYSLYDTKNIVRMSGDEYCLKENVVDELFTGDKINKLKALYCESNGGFIHNKNLISIKENKYSKFDPNVVKYSGKYYLRRNCFYNINNLTYIPKNKAIIIYDLVLDDNDIPVFKKEGYANIEHKNNFLELNTGELIINKPETRSLLIKRSKVYYVIKYYPEETNQLTFSFIKDKEVRWIK